MPIFIYLVFSDMITAEQLNSFSKNTLMKTLRIEFLVVEWGRIVASMPVDDFVHQPMGFLHGGASAALAESVASAGSFVMFEPDTVKVLGTEISCSHISSVKDGNVIAEAKILHEGISSHLWEVIIRTEQNRLVSVCRMTNRIIPV